MKIAAKLLQKEQRILITRITLDHARLLRKNFRHAVHHDLARSFDGFFRPSTLSGDLLVRGVETPLVIKVPNYDFRRVADFATIVNDRTENIGARRLHTVMEKLLDEISFEGPDLTDKRVLIDDAYVQKMLADIVKNEDLSRYIL